MATESSTTVDLLDRADAERAAGRAGRAARLYDEAVARCRADHDLAGWTRAALGAASIQLFGSEPGKLPALLHDVLLRSTDDVQRSRLEAALARCWVYAGHAARATRFADAAVSHAQRTDDAALRADALDAALAAHWGPDELDVRRSLATRLGDVAGHVPDPQVRLQAHLWGLQVACETLDVQAMHRQIRALELLAEESPRARFFAASRRLMFDLLRGRTDTTAHLIAVATATAREALLADAWMVLRTMDAYAAAQSGDLVRCAAGARACEEFAESEGVITVCAEAAWLWVCAGRLDRAAALAPTFHGSVLDDLPRDVNWLLTLQCVLEVALAVDDRELIEKAAALLAPYAGRAVFNVGAMMFHGSTDDTLARAYGVLGEPGPAGQLRSRALLTYERVGAQWWRHRLAAWSTAADGARADNVHRVRLHPTAGGLWLVGPQGTAVAGLRGFEYLRALIRRPGQVVPALDLAAAVRGAVEQSGLDELADRQALAASRRRLLDLDEGLAETEGRADPGRVDSAREEREALLTEVARATGPGGRPRTAGSSQERARVAVKKAITTAVDRIATIDQPLARHLRNRIHTGLSCSYDPEPGDGVAWVLDPPVSSGPVDA